MMPLRPASSAVVVWRALGNHHQNKHTHHISISIRWGHQQNGTTCASLASLNPNPALAASNDMFTRASHHIAASPVVAVACAPRSWRAQKFTFVFGSLLGCARLARKEKKKRDKHNKIYKTFSFIILLVLPLPCMPPTVPSRAVVIRAGLFNAATTM